MRLRLSTVAFPDCTDAPFSSRTSMLLVDARGLFRVLAAIGFSDIDMRPANMADASKLFEWRNHPSIRAVSRNSGTIAFEEHRNWLAKVLSDPRRILLIGERKGTPLGVVRFDEGEGDCEISIYLVPDSKEVGMGQELLAVAERWIRQNRPQIKELRATVLGANVRSQRLFARAGYRIESTKLAKSLSCYA